VLADRRLLLASARAEFLECADADLRGVPDPVVASRRRSVSSWVHPSAVTTEYNADLDFGSRLVRCARPVIEQLAEQIADILGERGFALLTGRWRALQRVTVSPAESANSSKPRSSSHESRTYSYAPLVEITSLPCKRRAPCR